MLRDMGRERGREKGKEEAEEEGDGVYARRNARNTGRTQRKQNPKRELSAVEDEILHLSLDLA